jgi:hypothetical protein
VPLKSDVTPEAEIGGGAAVIAGLFHVGKVL